MMLNRMKYRLNEHLESIKIYITTMFEAGIISPPFLTVHKTFLEVCTLILQGHPVALINKSLFSPWT